MGLRDLIARWPVFRQITGTDPYALGTATMSTYTEHLEPRTATADRIVKSVCPYCAVGCGQNVYVKDEQVVHIEGDPYSPVSRGLLCPKGSASLQLVTGSARRYRVLHRKPHAGDWEELDLDIAIHQVIKRLHGGKTGETELVAGPERFADPPGAKI